jgi:hypothetical protein
MVYVKDEDNNYQYNGTEWVEFGRGGADESAVRTLIVETYEDIALLENVGQGSLIYVKSDSNKNGEENMYVVTQDEMKGEIIIPKTYVALSTFAKSTVPTLKYNDEIPEGKKIYLNRDDEFILKFFFSSDTFGDGKFKIYKNGGLIRAFTAPKGNVLSNLGTFDMNGSYTIEVQATDYFGIPAPINLKYTVIVGGLELTSSFNETLLTAIYEVGDDITVPISAVVGDKEQKIKILFTVTQPNGRVVTDLLDVGTFEVSSSWENNDLFSERGLYHLKIQAYTGKDINDTTEGVFVSNILEYDFRVLAPKEIGIMSSYEKQIDTNTYASIPFKVTRKNTAMLIMRGTLYTKKNGQWSKYTETPDTGISANCNVNYYWSVGRLPEGEYRYELWGYSTDFTEKSIDNAVYEFAVVASSYKPVMPVTTSLIAWFDANDKRNSDKNKNVWKNKDIPELNDTYRIELHDLNYDDNGWKHIDGLGDDVNGEFVLKMNGQSWGQMVKVNLDGSTTPYSPFHVFSSGGQTGITIETAIKTRCNGDLDAKVMTCMDSNKTSGTPGCAIGYNQLYLASLSQPMSMEFMEEEWVHVAFVIDRDIRPMYGEGGVGQEHIEDLNPTRTMRIYINGVLCSCSTFTLDDKFLDAAEKSFPLMLNACNFGTKIVNDEEVPDIRNFGDCEIKFIRVYNRPLKSSDVVNNYVSHIFGQEKQQAMKDRNDTSVVALPKIVFERNLASSNKIEFSNLHAITDKAKSKKEFVDCTMFIHNLDGNIETIENVELYLQGTSSLQYPVKNYKIKKYNLPIGASGRKKEEFVPSIKEGEWVVDSTYTLKVDYMEQSHRNNTPTAVFYDQVIETLGAASPARKAGFRDAIDGFPCIVYYNNDPGGPDSNEVLVGSFMFNIDKEGKELGFECDVFDDIGNPLENKCISYEGTANVADTAGCFYALGDNIEKVYNYYLQEAYTAHLRENGLTQSSLKFDSFKEQVNTGKLPQYKTFEQYSAEYTEIDYIISDFEARYSYCEDDETATYTPMLDLVNWVSSCWEKQKDGSFKLNKTKFKSEFDVHFDMNYMLAYYLQMQVFAQVDNCGKNCMWDTWDGIKFYPRPYDMDTSMGLTNSGEEKIRSDAELIPDLSPTKAEGHTWAKYENSNRDAEDRYLMFNTKTSRLWNAFADVFKKEIATTYVLLRSKGGLNNKGVYKFDNIIKTIDSLTIDAIGEVYYNKDAGSKYLALTSDTTSEFLSMLHGNRTQKYRRFLSERLTFLDTIYEYQWAEKAQEDTLNSETRMRSDAAYDINTGKTESVQCHLGIAVYSPQYVTISVGSGKDAVVTAYVSPKSKYIDPNTGVEKEGTLFSFPVQGTNKEIGVFGSGNIKRIDRLETLNLTSISVEKLNKVLALNFSGSTRLSVLGLGQNTYLRELDCSRAMNLGTDNEGKTLNLSNCKNLQHMDVSVTKITGINFPKNTNLISCNCSYTNIAGVNINGAEFLTDIRITGCEDISDFTLDRCNKLEVLDISNSAVKNCKATNCSILKTVNVSHCSQLQSFDVSNSDMIEELIMTGNSGPVMKDLQLYSLYGLKKLVVNDSTTLSTIRLPKFESLEEAAKGDKGKSWQKLEVLDVRNSTVKKIQYGSKDEGAEICDMSKLINLKEFYCKGANAVTTIENLTYTAVNGVSSLFEACFNLKRVSGTINTSSPKADYMFYRCHKLNDTNDLTYNFKTEDNKPCITSAQSAFSRCASMTTPMLKKFLDACGSSLTNASNLVYMYGVDVNASRKDIVLGTANDTTRTIPYDLFVNTPNITNLTGAFALTCYTTIPGSLFDPIKSKLENLSSTFVNMEQLTKVEPELLKNCTALTDCYGTFAKCYALKDYINIDPNIFAGSTKIKTTNQMFYGDKALLAGTNGINGLFNPLTRLTTAEFMFQGCSAMRMAIPAGVFAKNTAITKLDGVFSNCTGITGIPKTLFRVNYNDSNNLSSLTLARNVFSGCSGIKGTVERYFFSGAPELYDIGSSCNTVEVFSGGNIVNVYNGFFGNTNLEGYHESILSTLPKLTNASRLFYHTSANGSLKYCYKTQGGVNVGYLNSLSPNMFINNKLLQNVSGMFMYNSNLSGHIPSNLFDPCKSTLTNVSYMFRGCTSLNGTDKDENDISGNKNVGLSNLWFKDAKGLTDASYFLYGCTSFLSDTLPEDLFSGCNNLRNITGFFRDCTNLTCSIPRGLLDSCRNNITKADELFYNCTSLTGELPTGQYTNTTGVVGYELANKGDAGALQVVETVSNFDTQVSYEQVIATTSDIASKITSNGTSYVKAILGTITKVSNGKYGFFANCLNLTTVAGAFYNCQKITGAIPYDIFYTNSASERYLNLTSVSSLFHNMRGLNTPYTDVTGTKYICNEDLFNKCPALTNISYLFNYLNGMPACNVFPNLFRNQSQITNAAGLFQFTYNLTGAITQNFLSSCLAKLQNANHMFDLCKLTSINQGFLNLGSRNSILRTVGCIFHGNFGQPTIADGGAGTAPEFWNKTMFPNIDTSTESGYQHAYAGCTKLTNYAAAAAEAEGAWVSSKSH